MSTQEELDSLGLNAQIKERLFLIEMCMFIVLFPQVLKLSLLVEDRALDTSLRRHAVQFLQNTFDANRDLQSEEGLLTTLLFKLVIKKVPLLDLRNIKIDQSTVYSPKMLLNLCLGLLKLAEIDESLKDSLREHLNA